MIAFAAFYIDFDSTTVNRIKSSNSAFTVTDRVQMLSTMLASAERFHPGCRKVVLTDRRTSLPTADFEVVRLDLDPSVAMLERFRAWSHFCALADSHVAFLDSDVLVCADLEHVFEDGFDVALTYRHRQDVPINSGVVFAHGDSLGQAIRFYEEAAARNLRDYPEALHWGGNQEVLRDMTDRADLSGSDSLIHEQGGFQVKLLPCRTYNFSARGARMPRSYPHAKILHFKGRRKVDMIPRWERMSSPLGPLGLGRLLARVSSWGSAAAKTVGRSRGA